MIWINETFRTFIQHDWQWLKPDQRGFGEFTPTCTGSVNWLYGSGGGTLKQTGRSSKQIIQSVIRPILGNVGCRKD